MTENPCTGFHQWVLASKSKSTADKYLNWLTQMKPNYPLTWAVERGLCPPDRTLPELSPAELYRIARLSAAEADDNAADDVPGSAPRSAVRACMYYRLEQESLSSEFVPGRGMTLSTVLDAFHQVRRAKSENAYTLIGRALLNNESFSADRKVYRERDLHLNGENYLLHRSVALWNLEHLHEETVSQLMDALDCLSSGQELINSTRLCAQLRADLGRAAQLLSQQLAVQEGFSGSETQRLLLRMAGLPPLSLDGATPNPDLITARARSVNLFDWYAPLSAQEMLRHMTELAAQLLQQALEWGGRGFPPAKPIQPQDSQDQLYCCLLAPFDRLLTITLCDHAKLDRAVIARLLTLGLFRVELLLQSGTSRLVSTGTLLQELSDHPQKAEVGQIAPMAEVWRSPTTRTILLSLLEQLDQKGQDLDESLLEQAPELVILLAAAPPEDSDQDGPIRRALDELHRLTGLALASPKAVPTDLLKPIFQLSSDLKTTCEGGQAVELLVKLLVRSHWNRSIQPPSPQTMESLGRLIDLYRKRPRTVTAALAPLLKPLFPDQTDLDFRMSEYQGESLLLSELHGRYAAGALALAMDPSLPLIQRDRWANYSHNAAQEGFQMARRQGEFLRAFDICLTRARALAVQAEVETQLHKLGAADLLSDFIPICAKALDQCRTWLETDIPAQKELEEARQRPFPESNLTTRRTALEEASAFCQAQFFALKSPVRTALEANAALWAAIPHTCTIAEDCKALIALQLNTPAAQNGADLSEADSSMSFPFLWVPDHRPAQQFMPWYCSYLDSETSHRKMYSQEATEAYMLKSIFSAQNLMLTVSQAVDNPALRRLAHVRGFQAMLRSGHISISFYWTFYSLRQYAAAQMRKKTFIWSSLPEEFGADMKAREWAAKYLEDSCTEADLPMSYRNMLVQFKESLILLDENLPSRWKVSHFQFPEQSLARLPDRWKDALPRRGAPGVSISLADRLNQYYALRQGSPLHEEMYRIHFLLLRPGLSAQERKSLDRSKYQKALDALRVGNLDGKRADSLGGKQADIEDGLLQIIPDLCDPAIFQRGSWQRKYLEDLPASPNARYTLDLMQSVLSYAQNRMLGDLCTPFQHHLYSQEERIIMPYDEASPINPSGLRHFEDTLTVVETGPQIGWDQAQEFTFRCEQLEREHPDLSADRLAGLLTDSGLDYTVTDQGDMLWLAKGTLYTSNDQKLLVEMQKNAGTIHLEMEGK